MGMCMCVSFFSRIVGNEMCIQFHARSLKRNANNGYKANANELSTSNGNMKERIEREKNGSEQETERNVGVKILYALFFGRLLFLQDHFVFLFVFEFHSCHPQPAISTNHKNVCLL